MRKIGLVILGLSLALSTSQSYAADKSFTTVQKAIDSLKVAEEVRAGYKRDNFKHWVGTGNGCDSRKSVIISESIKSPVVKKAVLLKAENG